MLTDHEINALNRALEIQPVDDHTYHIRPKSGNAIGIVFAFHTGEYKEGDPPRGITNEVLLAILINRLKNFQSGEFACRENALALTKLQEALHWLEHRTRARLARGIEGSHQK